MRVTLQDIAKATDVSISTVSLILSGKDHRISKETRKRVIQAANELHYQPNQLAVGLVTQRTHTLGLLIPDVSNAFFSEIAKGAEEAAFLAGYNILLCNTNDSAQRDLKYLNLMLGRNVDGLALVMSSPNTGAETLEYRRILEQAQKPVVLIDRVRITGSTSSVMIDHLKGGILSTQYLIDQGHRRIGCITGSIGLYTALLRFNGYKQALETNQIPLDMDIVEHGHYHLEDGESMGERLICKGCTAIFACNDLMAFGVYKAAKKRKIKIPAQLSVIGFDNIVFSELADPPLTTIAQRGTQIGIKAVNKLIKLVENKDESNESIALSPELIVRESVKERCERS